MISALGCNTNMVYHAVNARISAYESVDYFTQNRERMNMALVPDGALPPLINELNPRGKIHFRHSRILRMCHVAAAEAMANFTGKAPIPLFFSAPADDVGLTEQFPRKFIHYLVLQSGLPIDAAASRLIGTGRTGGLEALDLALRYLYDTDAECVLIGGGESFQDSELLAALDKEGRINAPGVPDGFAPGEGAAFVLLTRNPALAMHSATHIPTLLPPGRANEPGHLFSDEPYRGEGLAKAFRLALAAYEGETKIAHVYSSMNGENYWAKEYGVAMVRTREAFAESTTVHHPADCYGDLGAATGTTLMALAAQRVMLNKPPRPWLIYCSSDHTYRAAACFEPVALTTLPPPVEPTPPSVWSPTL